MYRDENIYEILYMNTNIYGCFNLFRRENNFQNLEE